MTAKEKVETAVMRAVNLQEVPPEKASVMIRRTVLGLLFAGLGVYLTIGAEGVKLYLGVGFVLIGATTWSGQIVTGALTALLGPFKAFREASRGD